MNEELLILRDYLFHFLRPSAYKTDVNFYLPKFLVNDPAFAETQRTLSWEHERYRLKVIDFAKQFHPQTATWGLSVWEEELGLSTDLSVDLELRRAKVMAKLLGTSPMTVANTNKLVNLFTDDGKAYVDELPEPGIIKIIVPSKTAYLDEMRDSLDEMLPAHLAYYFRRIIEIDDDEDESEGKTEGIISVDDESTDDSAFFMHADFPIRENIPYGRAFNLPKYDGSVQVISPDMLNGKLRYDGLKDYDGINEQITKFGKEITWWFTSRGNTTFNKEFKHNGAVLYDGLQPQTIEYEDGIDEISVTRLENRIEEDVVEKPIFDGEHKFNGNTAASCQKIPSDNNGIVEINKSRRYNGTINFNGGDINQFNGAIRATGDFNFEGSGARAQSVLLTDKLDGSVNFLRPIKETPLSNLNPDIEEYVPITLEKQITKIIEPDISDVVESAEDVGNALRIAKALKYDGIKLYDGGNINYFNGGIKADGAFNFAGDGNKAAFEILAIDTDGKFSVQAANKNEPPLYEENVDFVNPVYDETHFRAEIIPADTAEVKDFNGDMTIRRRARYDGILLYGGYFEYTADGGRHFDGVLNYGGICVIKWDGTAHYNGIERYGGRKNSNYIDFVTNLDGSAKVIHKHLWKLPIATRTRLGYVIIGNNINVNDEGKISMPSRFNQSSMDEMRAGHLKQLWRSKYAN